MTTLLVCGQAFTCDRTPAGYQLTRKGEAPIYVMPSPRADGTWFAMRRFLAVTFHVVAGQLAVGRPARAA